MDSTPPAAIRPGAVERPDLRPTVSLRPTGAIRRRLAWRLVTCQVVWWLEQQAAQTRGHAHWAL
jgi:hypothetical protein